MYREPTPPSDEPVDDDEAELLRAVRKRRARIGLIVGLLVIGGTGTCAYPIVRNGGANLWNAQKTPLSRDEAKHVGELLDAIEGRCVKNQLAFDAAWPGVREGKILPHAELGDCNTANIPKPSLELGGDAVYWTFIDLTTTNARAALDGIALRTAPSDKPPTLASTAPLLRVSDARKQAAEGIQRDHHNLFIENVEAFAKEGAHVEIVVLVDEWKDHPVEGAAHGKAFIWDPAKAKFTCTANAYVDGKNGLELDAMRKDIALKLEAELICQLDPAGEGQPTTYRAHYGCRHGR